MMTCKKTHPTTIRKKEDFEFEGELGRGFTLSIPAETTVVGSAASASAAETDATHLRQLLLKEAQHELLHRWISAALNNALLLPNDVGGIAMDASHSAEY